MASDAGRPRLIAQQRFAEHREELAALDLAARFAYIHERNLWEGAESRSGAGSGLDETETLRRELPGLLARLGVRELLDVPCGDFRWLSETDLACAYTGADIVPALAAENETRFAGAGRRFLTLDLTRDPLPPADAVLCRDCLVHLSFANIEHALTNLRRGGARWLLATTFPGIAANRDIEDGDWRPLNLALPPLGLGAPAELLVEGCREGGGAYADKALGVWRLGG